MNPIRRFQQVEALFREKVANKVIKGLLFHRGIPVEVFRRKIIPAASQNNPSTDASTLSLAALNVFGDLSGISPGKHEPITETVDPVTGNIRFCAKVVITKIPSDPFDAASSGILEKQILYTQDDLQPNDMIVIRSEDGTIKRMVVGLKLSTGISDTVYFKFEANNLGGSDS